MIRNYIANRILIVNDEHDVGFPYAPLFQGMGDITHDIDAFLLNPHKFKLIQFTGGADVSPSLYGDTSPKNVCRSSSSRDKQEAKIFNKARSASVRMAGICRGLQFLNVMAGGKMMHHISGHSGEHEVCTSNGFTPSLRVNSFHHQMCIPAKGTYTMAWSTEKLSTGYTGDKDEDMKWYGPEVEALFMPAVMSLGVQWHPEALAKGQLGREFYINMINDYLIHGSSVFRESYLGEDYVHRTAHV